MNGNPENENANVEQYLIPELQAKQIAANEAAAKAEANAKIAAELEAARKAEAAAKAEANAKNAAELEAALKDLRDQQEVAMGYANRNESNSNNSLGYSTSNSSNNNK